MVTEGGHYSQYDPSAMDQLLGEAAYLLREMGFAASHMTLIGGIVPGMLVPSLDPGMPAHVGTADLDLCIGIAIVAGDVAEYRKIETCLQSAGYREDGTSWRWRGGETGHVVVEFFCPAGPGREPGRLFRPKGAENPRAKKVMGGSLSALELSAGELIGEDVQIVEREVELPRGGGRMTASFRITGPLGFLVAKASALRERNKPKDAYDIIWLLESWPGGPAALARGVAMRPAYTRPEVPSALGILADQFRDFRSTGAVSYARFIADPDEAQADLAQRAVGAMQEFRRSLPD